MKVVDIQIYRNRKAVEDLEKKISEHCLYPKTGSVNEMKIVFREWLKKRV